MSAQGPGSGSGSTGVEEPSPPAGGAPAAGGVAPLANGAQPSGTPSGSAPLGSFVSLWLRQVRSGESSVLPVVAGFIVLVIIFQTESAVFLSAGNLTNLLVQGATFVLLGMAEVFVLLLGEIDLSIGYNAAVGGTAMALLASQPNPVPWPLAILVGLAVSAFFGVLQGTLITRLGLPSFIVTLAGLLGLEGVLLALLDLNGAAAGGVVQVTSNVISDLVNGNLDNVAGWIVTAALVAVFGTLSIRRDRFRRTNGLHAPPVYVTLAKVVLAAAAGFVLVAICNTNRGSVASPVTGVPWVVLILAAFIASYTFLLGRTRFGRYVYAIGGNPEAARRAGVSLARIRTICFGLSGFTAAAGGIIYASRLGSISSDFDGGSYVLYAVAAAVIGGTSLFGGRGKMIHAVLGGVIIATIYNGLGLLNLSAAVQYMVVALVLLAAVILDALARRQQRVTGR